VMVSGSIIDTGVYVVKYSLNKKMLPVRRTVPISHA